MPRFNVTVVMVRIARIASYARALSAAGLLLGGAATLGDISFAQILGPQLPGQYPGQYPPGTTYPGGQGGSIPGRSRRSSSRTTPDQNTPAQTYIGRLRRAGNNEIAVETDDKRVLTVGTGTNTKYFDDGGKSAAPSLFHPGDRISLDASQDDNGYLHALRVRMERAGSADDRARAADPVDESPVARGSVANDGDSDRPRLRRADSKPAPKDGAGSSDTTTPAPTAQATTATKSTTGAAKSDDDEYVVPVERKATASTAERAAAPPADPDDPGPPTLRRGKPTNTRTSRSSATADDAASPAKSSTQTVASARRPVSPQIIDGDSDAPTPAPSERPAAYRIARGGDPVIEKAREAATEFTETLPNYTVKQFTTRFYSENVHGKSTSWQPLDNVTADVVYEAGKESYRNILVNGKPPKDKIEKTGSWSSGEFATVLRDVLSPATDAHFYNKRSSTIVNRAATRFDFTVEQENSHWHVYAASQSFRPSYSGAIWIDKETSRVLRIEMSAKSMPSDFPLDTVESATDYDFVQLTNAKFLLPVHSESLSCTRGSGQCSRNVIDFRNYRKFGADTSITFDAGADSAAVGETKKKP